MKQLFKRLACLLALGMVLAMAAPFAALAAEAPYTYTVTLSMGRHGTYSHTGISVGLSDANILPTVTATDSMITISNLAKGSRVNLGMDAAALDANGKYYVQGVRISGRDNNTATVPSFAVTEDADYVMAYGIKGDLTQYTVNYQDTDGNALAPSRIYYGNVGDKPVVAYLYIDGYQPRSYNLTKTLVANSAENVFTFVYSRLSGGGNGGNGGGTGTGGTGTGTGTGTGDDEGGTPPPQDIIIYIPAPGGTTRPTTGNNGGNGGGNNNGGNNTATTDDDENADTEEEQPVEEVVEVVPAPNPGNGNNGGNNGANNGAGTGEETLGDGAPEELTDIDANRTPLANIVRQIVETVSNASPVALAGGGIAIAAVVGLLIFLLVARKKKKKDEDNASDEQSGDR